MKKLDKKKLKLIKIEPFPQGIETSQFFNEAHAGSNEKNKLKYIFNAKVSRDSKSRILVVTFFNLETKTSVFRIFFNKKNFIIERLFPDRRWSNAMLHSMWYELCYAGSTVCVNEKSAKVIQNFFNSEGAPCSVMDKFQRDLRQNQLKQRHQREMDQIDKHMKSIRPLPKDFQKWVNEVPLDFSRYIYYQRASKRLINGYCTSCSNGVEFHITHKTPWKNVRHNKQGKCPCCKKNITFLAVGMTRNRVDTTCATYVQKTKNGFVLRYFEIEKKYSNNPAHPDYFRHPVLKMHESARHFFESDNGNWTEIGKHYEFGYFKQTNIRRWCKSNSDAYAYTTPIYTRNLQYALADSPWKFSAFYELLKNEKNIPIQRYFKEYKKHPAYEYLVKARLYRLVNEKMDLYVSYKADLNFNGKSVYEILGVNKAGFQQMQRLNGGCDYLALIRLSEETSRPMTDEQLQIFINMRIHNGLLKDLLAVASPQKIINYISRCKECWVEEKHSNTVSTIATYWRDYLKICVFLGYDMKNDFNIFPKNLKVRHDEVVEDYKAERDTIQEKAIMNLHPLLQGVFGYTHKDLGLVAIIPSTRDEIISEGEILRHCVHTGSYIQKMVEGTGYIIFVRKVDSPETPYFTAEIVDGVIQQCRGEKNCEMTDDVKKFVDHWQKELARADAKSFTAEPVTTAQVVA